MKVLRVIATPPQRRLEHRDHGDLDIEVMALFDTDQPASAGSWRRTSTRAMSDVEHRHAVPLTYWWV